MARSWFLFWWLVLEWTGITANDRDSPQKPSGPWLQYHFLGMVFLLMERTYSPFTAGVPTVSASYLGYAAYDPGRKGVPGPTWGKDGYSGKKARDRATGVCLTPESKGMCASTPVCACVCGCEDAGGGEAAEAEGRDPALLCVICHLAVV